MDNTLLSVQSLASTYLGWFEKSTRDDDSEFYKLIDGHPPELLTLVRLAHGDMLPDDWRYKFIHECLTLITESNDLENPEIEPDDYYHDLLKWLSSRNDRCTYTDEYAEDYGTPEPFDTMTLIAKGQIREKEEVYWSVLSSLQNQVDAEEDES